MISVFALEHGENRFEPLLRQLLCRDLERRS